MLDLNLLKNSWFFKTKTLKKWEILFDEWEKDTNLYVIIRWELKIEKYTTKKRNETKVLAYLKNNEVFWEAALNSDKEKEVKIQATITTSLLYIDAKYELNQFTKKHPEEWLNLLKYIIYLSNKRLLESNYLITANYKVSQEISKIKEINNKSVFELIQKLKDIVNADYIVYLEENPIMQNYTTIKYDTRKEWKMLDIVIETAENKLSILELKNEWYNNSIHELTIWSDNLWLLIFFKKWKDFNDNDKKVLTSVTTSIAWLIKQKIILEEEKNKNLLLWENF